MNAALTTNAANDSMPPALTDNSHYELVSRAIHYLRENQHAQPELAELARTLGTSESHLQRVFSAWAGISPKRFLQALTRERAVAALKDNASVLDASLAAGLSGPGRLHDLTISCDAMTPGEIRSAGGGLQLRHGWGSSPFGVVFLAWCERGICHLSFHNTIDDAVPRAFREEWKGAAHSADNDEARALAERIFARPLEPGRLHVLLRGTNFQIKVWEALLRVPSGQLASYRQLSAIAGTGKAYRAVGSAMASNRIGYLIPCHRVIRESGDLGNYRWGIDRKLAIQLWEGR